jgi:hypothetical protein
MTRRAHDRGPAVSRLTLLAFPNIVVVVIAIGVALDFAIVLSIIFFHSAPNPTSPFSASGSPSPPPPLPSMQQLLQEHLKRDEQALDKGVLSYPRLRLYTGVPHILHIAVTDIGKHPRGHLTATELSRALGLVVYPGDVPTGGIVGLSTSLCVNLQCRPLNNGAQQSIAGEGSRRSWSWELTPERPGPASLIIAASTYDGKSSTSLNEEIIQINLQVLATPSFKQAQSAQIRNHEVGRATGFVNTAVGLIAAVVGAAAAIGGGILSIIRWMRRSRKKKAERRARAEAKIVEQETAERRAYVARMRQEEVERQKQDFAWRRPL